MKFKNILKRIFQQLPETVLILHNISEEPVARASTYKKASKKAISLGIEHPIFMREPLPGTRHIH